MFHLQDGRVIDNLDRESDKRRFCEYCSQCQLTLQRKFRRCGRCKVVWYCGQDCQKKGRIFLDMRISLFYNVHNIITISALKLLLFML